MRHADELLKLAKGLRTVDAANFNIDNWGYERREVYTCSPKECHTVCCAAGWLPTLVPGCGIKHAPDSFAPTYKGDEGFTALRRYFQIPHAILVRIFTSLGYSPDDYTNEQVMPGDVADAIEDMVSEVRDIERQARRDMRVELRKKAKKTTKKRK